MVSELFVLAACLSCSGSAPNQNVPHAKMVSGSSSDRVSQDRGSPYTFVTNRGSFGFRLECSDLLLGDSNKGRVAISEIRVWEYV